MKKIKRIKALPLIIAAVVLLSLVCILPSVLMAESERIVVDLSTAELAGNLVELLDPGYNEGFVGMYSYDAEEEACALSYTSGSNAGFGRYSFYLRFISSSTYSTDYKYATVCYKTNTTEAVRLVFGNPGNYGYRDVFVSDLSATAGEWTYSAPIEFNENTIARLGNRQAMVLAAEIKAETGVEFYLKEIVFFKTAADAAAYVAEAPAIPKPEPEEGISFISADEYGILADDTKIAVIKAEGNTQSYKYAGKTFYYAENLGGYAAIVDKNVTADAILADAEVTNTPASVINTNGDVNYDDSVTAADAAYINRMLANPNGSYRDRSRLAAEVMAVNGTITIDKADVYFVLRAAIGLTTTEDDIPTDSVEVNGVIIPMTSLDAALENLVVYNNDDVTGGASTSYGDNVGSYEFHEQQEALLIKKSPSNYLGGYYRYHIKPISAELLTDESWMVVMYRTNAKTAAEMKLVSNSNMSTDIAVLAEDITVSDDEWMFTTPVNIDTDLAEVDLFDRFTTAYNHSGLIVTLPEDTANDVYFFVKEIAFFASEREAKAYIANTELPKATTVVLDLGLSEDQWIDPAVISFKSEGATKVNASVTDGVVEYTDDYALLSDSVSAQFNSPAYVMDNHKYVSVYYKATENGTLMFNDTVIAADTSVSAGEWTNTKPIKLTDDTKAALSEGDANVISYTGDGEITLGEIVLLSAPAQATTHIIGESEPAATNEPITWVFASAEGDKQNYEGSSWMGSQTMYNSGVKFVADSDETRGYFAFDTIGGINALRVDRCDDSSVGYGGNHVFLRTSKTQNYMPLKYMRIKYYVTGLDDDSNASIRFASGAGSVYAETKENLVEKQGRWVYSQVLDLTELTSGSDPDFHNFNVLNRVQQGKIVYVGLFNAPVDAKLYISEITFYETKAQAYADASMDAYEPQYLDAKLGKFTVASVFDGEGMGEWSYSKQGGFQLENMGNANDGGNYRMAFRFVLYSMISQNKYMRVVYKANNGSATEPVQLVTHSPKTGDTVVLETNVQNTDEWTLSNAVLLSQDLFDRLGGTGEYLKNQTFEFISQEHNFVAFQNTASDAEYAIRDIYFFSTVDDALNFEMPETPAAPVSEITVGGTTYESTEAIATVDAALGNAYKIYVNSDKLYAVGGTDAAAAFAKKVADGRVLGGDTYEDIVEISVAADFVLNGTYPTASAEGNVALKYDDRYTFDKAVAYVESTEITSTDAVTGEADVSVLKRVDGETFAASAIGTATVYFLDGTSTTVTVAPAKLSLVMIAGQSNAEGHSGNYLQSIRSEPGQVYSTYACAGYRYINSVLGPEMLGKGIDALSIYNNDVYIPESLTSTVSRIGSDLTYLPTNLTEGGNGKGGTDSAIAYEWNKATGEKIWIINAAHSASGIDSWQPGSSKTNNNFWQAVDVFKSAEETVKAEIAAGHYELSKMGYFWLQGCSDSGTNSLSYTTRYKNMHEGFKAELAFDHDSDTNTADRTIEFGAIMLVRVGTGGIMDAEDFAINGPRMSQYYMGNEKTESWMNDIYLATDITNIFKSDAAVAEYFTTKYGTEENFQRENNVTYAMPLTAEEVHPNIHYCQAGYNEVGRDAAYNLLRQIGMVEVEAADVTIELLDATGNVFDHTAGLTLGANKFTTILPDVSPRYLATDITVEYSSNIVRDSKSQYVFTCTDGNAAYVTFKCGNASVTVNING